MLGVCLIYWIVLWCFLQKRLLRASEALTFRTFGTQHGGGKGAPKRMFVLCVCTPERTKNFPKLLCPALTGGFGRRISVDFWWALLVLLHKVLMEFKGLRTCQEDA